MIKYKNITDTNRRNFLKKTGQMAGAVGAYAILNACPGNTVVDTGDEKVPINVNWSNHYTGESGSTQILTDPNGSYTFKFSDAPDNVKNTVFDKYVVARAPGGNRLEDPITYGRDGTTTVKLNGNTSIDVVLLNKNVDGIDQETMSEHYDKILKNGSSINANSLGTRKNYDGLTGFDGVFSGAHADVNSALQNGYARFCSVNEGGDHFKFGLKTLSSDGTHGNGEYMIDPNNHSNDTRFMGKTYREELLEGLGTFDDLGGSTRTRICGSDGSLNEVGKNLVTAIFAYCAKR